MVCPLHTAITGALMTHIGALCAPGVGIRASAAIHIYANTGDAAKILGASYMAAEARHISCWTRGDAAWLRSRDRRDGARSCLGSLAEKKEQREDVARELVSPVSNLSCATWRRPERASVLGSPPPRPQLWRACPSGAASPPLTSAPESPSSWTAWQQQQPEEPWRR